MSGDIVFLVPNIKCIKYDFANSSRAQVQNWNALLREMANHTMKYFINIVFHIVLHRARTKEIEEAPNLLYLSPHNVYLHLCCSTLMSIDEVAKRERERDIQPSKVAMWFYWSDARARSPACDHVHLIFEFETDFRSDDRKLKLNARWSAVLSSSFPIWYHSKVIFPIHIWFFFNVFLAFFSF